MSMPAMTVFSAAPRERRPIRLAVFSPIYGLNGPVAGLRWWFLSRYLVAAGAEVAVFHHSADTGALPALSIAGGATPREVYVPAGGAALARLGRSAGRLIGRCSGERPGKVGSLLQAAVEQLHLYAQSARGLVQAYERVFRARPPDVLVGCFIGWSGIRAALALSRRGIPLVLEFRDPWRQYHPDTWPYHHRRIHAAVRQAASVISVTPLLCARDQEEFSKPAWHLPHGFPPEALEYSGTAPAAGPLRVGYFGSLCYPYFDYRCWFEGLAQLGPGVAEFHYAGNEDTRVRHLNEEFGVADRVQVSPRIDIGDVFRRQRGMDVLLAFASTDPADPELFGYKIAEVRAAGRPVLVVGPPNESLHNFLAAGTRVVWARAPAEVAAALRTLADEKCRHGAVRADVNERVVREMGWDRIAGRLLDELEQLLASRPASGPAG